MRNRKTLLVVILAVCGAAGLGVVGCCFLGGLMGLAGGGSDPVADRDGPRTSPGDRPASRTEAASEAEEDNGTDALSAEDSRIGRDCYDALAEAVDGAMGECAERDEAAEDCAERNDAAEEEAMEDCAERNDVSPERAEEAYLKWVAAGMPGLGGKQDTSADEAPAQAGPTIDGEHVVGCLSEGAYDGALERAARGQDPRRQPGCAHLSDGTPVEIVDTEDFGSLVQVELRRNGKRYWLATEHVDK